MPYEAWQVTAIVVRMQGVSDVVIGQHGRSAQAVLPALVVCRLRFPHYFCLVIIILLPPYTSISCDCHMLIVVQLLKTSWLL